MSDSNQAGHIPIGGENPSAAMTLMEDSVTKLARLSFIEGFRKDETYALIKPETQIGRELGNDVIFEQDGLVSRKHACIFVIAGEYVLENKSSNGTLHNGKLIKEKDKRIKLRHGDQIQIGKTLMRFELVGHALEESKAQPQQSATTLIVLLIILFCALSGAVVYFFLQRKPTPVAKKPPERRGPSKAEIAEKARQVTRKKTLALLDKGMGFYKERKWKEASFQFQKASLLAPKDPEVKRLLGEVRAELRCKTALGAVKVLLKARHLKRCERHEKAWSTLSQAAKHLAVGSVYAEPIWQQQHAVWRGLRRYCKKRKGKAMPPPPKAPISTLVETTRRRKNGVMLFNGGQAAKALEFFRKKKKKKRLRQVKDFLSAYESGRSAYNSRKARKGIRSLNRALSLDREIGGGKSLYTSQVKMMLAELYYRRGVNALEYKGNYASAFRNFRAARKFNPKHAMTKARLKTLRAKAQAWYKAALKYFKKKRTTEAQRMLRKATEVLPQSDPLYSKIRAKLLGH